MPSPSWRALIVDDEPAARRGVRQLLRAFPEFVVAGECRNGREALAALDVLAPDVVFLDIQMPELGGFEVIRRRAAESMPLVVFVTAYDEFAIRAFDAEALDYLVKPLNEERFAAAMRRVLKRLRAARGAPSEPALVVSTPRGALVIELGEIDWIEAADYYARVWIGPRSYLIRESLDRLERRVGAHGFVRAHRRAILRVAGVRALRSDNGDQLTAILSSGIKIPISRRRRADVVAAVRARG
jgi:two-component system, LytTR family, response regulator